MKTLLIAVMLLISCATTAQISVETRTSEGVLTNTTKLDSTEVSVTRMHDETGLTHISIQTLFPNGQHITSYLMITQVIYRENTATYYVLNEHNRPFSVIVWNDAHLIVFEYEETIELYTGEITLH